MILQYMPKQHIQCQEISDKELCSHVSDLLDELEGVQQGLIHLLAMHRLTIGPLIQTNSSGRMPKRTAIYSRPPTNYFFNWRTNHGHQVQSNRGTYC